MLYTLSKGKKIKPIKFKIGDVLLLMGYDKEQWRYLVLNNGDITSPNIWWKCLLMTPFEVRILDVCLDGRCWKQV